MTARLSPVMLGLAIAGLLAGCTTTNPTKVNGQVVSSPALIENGATIEMGRTLLRFKKD